MSLDRFELLELRRQGAVETYHAREIATARPVQVHFFVAGETPETAELLALIRQLPDTERRRVIDRGESRGFPYVVTDRLAGYADFRDWVTANSRPTPSAPSPALTIDEQFFQLFDSPRAPEPEPDPFARIRAPELHALSQQQDPVFFPVGPAAAAPAPAPDPFSGIRLPEKRDEPSLLGASIEIEAVRPRRGFFSSAFKSILWLILGIFAALAFLAALAAFFVFRPR